MRLEDAAKWSKRTSQRYERFKHEEDLRTNRENLQTIRDSYPSPDRSVATSPVPALDDSVTDESEEEEDVAPPVIAGSKRRRLSVEPVDHLSAVGKPVKRLRYVP